MSAAAGVVDRRLVIAGGYGRVGKRVTRAVAAMAQKQVGGVANLYGGRGFLDPAKTQFIVTGNKPLDRVAGAIKYDSIAGRFTLGVEHRPPNILVFRAGDSIVEATYMLGGDVTANGLPAFEHGPTVLIDATGAAKDRKSEKFAKIEALKASAIVVTNPLKGADAISVLGINHLVLAELAARAKAGQKIVLATGSCSTNAGAVTAAAVEARFEILAIIDGMTVHSGTSSNTIVDEVQHNPDAAIEEARGRGLLGNIIPATTGLAKAFKPVMAGLAPRIGPARGFRVPVADGAILQLIFFVTNKDGDSEDTGQEISNTRVAKAFKDAAEHGMLAGVLGVTDYPAYTSLDVINDRRAGVVMLPWLTTTEVAGVGELLERAVGRPVRQVTSLTAYDNEGWVPFSALNQANLLTGLLTGDLKTLPGAEAAGG